MKIVFLSVSGSLGGAERALLDLLASLRAARPGWELHLLVGADGPLLAAAASLGVGCTLLRLPRAVASFGDAGAAGRGRGSVLLRILLGLPSALRYAVGLRRALRRLAPDVVHTNGFKMHAMAARSLPPGAKLVWHLHDFTSARPLMREVLLREAPRAAAALAVSRAVADDARAICGPGLDVRVVYNAVDLERFRPDGPALALHELAGMPAEGPGTVRVGLVATMGMWKGHEVFLRALAALPADLPVRGYVVGGGIYQTRGSETPLEGLKALAAELGISDRVGFTGFVDDPAAAMRALDVVVHASTHPEPFGLVIAEAMACGRAVVVSAAGGAAEIVQPGRDALAFSPGDVEGLAWNLRRLVSDPKLRARLGQAGRKTAEKRFDRARLGAEVAPLYERIVSSSGEDPVESRPPAAAGGTRPGG